VSLTAELLEEFEPDIETIELIPSDGGRFEVTVNDDLVYSKLATHRHAEAGEISQLVQAKLSAG
jgi:selenoprotein W-related protein